VDLIEQDFPVVEFCSKYNKASLHLLFVKLSSKSGRCCNQYFSSSGISKLHHSLVAECDLVSWIP
jgi:hypothetical protein